MRRRPLLGAVLAAAAGALAAGGLGGCGFHLRGAVQLPFDSVFLNLAPSSTFRAELARNIRTGTSTRVVDAAAGAGAVLDLLGEVREREILSLNAQGRAREYQLRYRIAFRLHDGKGYEMIPPTEIRAQRDITFNDAQILAKESEEALLYRDMQSDLVQQLLRRLATARPYVPESNEQVSGRSSGQSSAQSSGQVTGPATGQAAEPSATPAAAMPDAAAR